MGAREVAIVGGGIIGLASAWRLRQAGVAVTLVDPGAPVGAAASPAAAGMLAPQLEAASSGPMLELCLRARRGYRLFVEELQATTGMDVGFREDGALQLAVQASDAERLEQRVRWQQAEGLRADWLTRDQMQALEPAVSADIEAAASFPGEGQVDNRKLLQALTAACIRAEVRWIRERVVSVTHGSDTGPRRRPAVSTEGASTRLEADAVVVAAGAWSALLPGLLPAHAVEPVRGEILQYQLAAVPFRRVLSCHDGYLVPRADGRILVGSTMDRAGFDARVTPEGARRLSWLAARLVPQLRDATPTAQWTGLRPGTPDGLPLLGWGASGDVLFATGHFRNGILLADVTARLVAALFTDEPEPSWMGAFRPTRSFPAWTSGVPAQSPGPSEG